MSLVSCLIPAVLHASQFIDFKYMGAPRRLGCTLVLAHDTYYLYLVIFLAITMGVNLIFLATYRMLQSYFKSKAGRLNVTPQMIVLQKGALTITFMAASTYFISYLPGTVVYTIICVSPSLIKNLPFPYYLILDGAMRFTPHLNSCLFPLFLVSGSTLENLKKAASITNNSFRNGRYGGKELGYQISSHNTINTATNVHN